MAYLRLFPILIVAIFCYVTLIDTAALRGEEFAEKLQRMTMDVGHDNLRTQRAIENTGGQPTLVCYSNPCGWAVYEAHTRRISYFMKNTCDCPNETYKCVRSDDDLSVSAYVYHCRQNTTVDDIEAPNDAL